MDEIKYDEVTKLIQDSLMKSSFDFDYAGLNINNYFKSRVQKKAILGIDIYKYSKFKFHQQSLVPLVFHEIIKMTLDQIAISEPTLFRNYINPDSIKFENIDTGDGGFFIFNNPLEAVIFTIYFHSILHLYNSSNLLPDMNQLRKIIGEITIRYAMTYDDIYTYDKKYYGSGIITCARILSKDKLNRFLIDRDSVDWFSTKMNSVENLQSIRSDDLQMMDFLKDVQKFDSSFFSENTNRICNVDLLKIGGITAKGDSVDIYNLCLKVFMKRGEVILGSNAISKHTITVGNLNTSGID